MACGFGACFGCVVPGRGGGYLRVCVDGPVIDAAELDHVGRATPGRPRVSVEFCGLELAHPVINGSGTFDALAAAEAFGDGAAARTSRSRPTSPRRSRWAPRRQPAAAAVGGAGRADQLDRPAQQGPRRISARGPAAARGLASGADPVATGRAADHERDGLDRRGARAAVEACERRAEIAAIELNVSCPNVQTGLDIGADPRQLRAVLARACGRRTRQAADRQAHAQHRRRAGLRAAPPRRGSGRGLADQHAARDGARARRRGASPPTVARGRHAAGSRGPRSGRSRWPRWRPSPSACAIPVIGMGGVQSGAPRARAARRRREARGGRDRELPRPRRRPRGSPPSCSDAPPLAVGRREPGLKILFRRFRRRRPRDSPAAARCGSRRTVNKTPAKRHQTVQQPRCIYTSS